MRPVGRGRSAATLIELMCVLMIIAILASMLLPAVARAYHRARSKVEELEAPQIADLLRTQTRNYCAANPRFTFLDQADFLEKCRLNPKCRDWVQAVDTIFVPFNYLTPDRQVVLCINLGRNRGRQYVFSKGELSIRPEER